jgi:aspartate dehydrogenase
MAKMKVGLVGCGNIGADICIALQKGDIPAEITALTDVDPERAAVLQRSFQLDATIGTLDDLASSVDFIVECAVGSAVREVLEAAMRHKTNCLIMSVGGLMALTDVMKQAQDEGVQVRVPSGALCGLDGIRAAAAGGLHLVRLTTRKPPEGLAGAPYLVENNIDVDNLKEPKIVFEGTALEAVSAFPANVNVAGALSLAGIGPEETRVCVIADPKATMNSHEVEAEGAFGSLKTVTTNLPSPRNAKSSYLASLSANVELRAAAMAFGCSKADS